MARVTYGAEITELSGSIRGVTFQRNPSGNIARGRPNRTINPSNLLSNKQSYLSYLVSLWNTLDLTAKQGWNDLAAAHDHTDPWGNIRTISGYQWFLSNNLNLYILEAGIITEAPEYVLPPAPPSFELILSDSDLYLEFSESYDPSPYTLIIYSSPPIRTSSAKSRKNVFVIDVGSSPTGAVLSILNSFTNKFGFSLAELLAANFYTLALRTCVIDESTGFRSTNTLAIQGKPLSWTDTQEYNTYPSSTNGHYYIDWGDSNTDEDDFMGTLQIGHEYADNGSHYVSVGITWSGGGNGWDSWKIGKIGYIQVFLESTP